MPRAVRIRSSLLLHIARPELGCALEKDGSQAGAPERHMNASLHRKGNTGWNLDAGQEIREGKQCTGTRL